MLTLMFVADDITEIYFLPTDEAWNISKRMPWLFPSFPVLNGICGIFMRDPATKKSGFGSSKT